MFGKTDVEEGDEGEREIALVKKKKKK